MTRCSPEDGSHLTVLIVDDDEDFRRALADSLRDDGHTVDDFASPTAMPPASAFGRYSLMITDYRMTPEDGLELIERFQAAEPGKPAILVTSFADGAVERALATRPHTWLLEKPFDYEELRALIERVGA